MSTFPSPQVGSGRGLVRCNWRRFLEFPSPQVGSGRRGSGGGGLTKCGFHPLKSGRDCSVNYHQFGVAPCFHPLKSGRDYLHFTTPTLPTMFPSPQVGSGHVCQFCARCVPVCFHPLKSGRDWQRAAAEKGAQRLFPSPQVGSGLVQMGKLRLTNNEFPSPQVGSGHFRSRPAPLQFNSFHPLKSGRDKYR